MAVSPCMTLRGMELSATGIETIIEYVELRSNSLQTVLTNRNNLNCVNKVFEYMIDVIALLD